MNTSYKWRWGVAKVMEGSIINYPLEEGEYLGDVPLGTQDLFENLSIVEENPSVGTMLFTRKANPQ